MFLSGWVFAFGAHGPMPPVLRSNDNPQGERGNRGKTGDCGVTPRGGAGGDSGLPGSLVDRPTRQIRKLVSGEKVKFPTKLENGGRF